MSSAPRLTPSSLSWTPTTPTLSVAFTDTVIVPETVAPADGAVMETDGGVVSLKTVTLIAAAVAVFPPVSRPPAVQPFLALWGHGGGYGNTNRVPLAPPPE